MNKHELAQSVALKCGLNVKQAAAAINATILTIRQTVKSGDDVLLVGFGKFLTSQDASRRVINPRTLQSLTLPARRSFKFKASKSMQAYVR